MITLHDTADIKLLSDAVAAFLADLKDFADATEPLLEASRVAATIAFAKLTLRPKDHAKALDLLDSLPEDPDFYWRPLHPMNNSPAVTRGDGQSLMIPFVQAQRGYNRYLALKRLQRRVQEAHESIAPIGIQTPLFQVRPTEIHAMRSLHTELDDSVTEGLYALDRINRITPHLVPIAGWVSANSLI